MPAAAAVDEPAGDVEDLAAQGRCGRALEVGAGEDGDGSTEVVGHDREGEPGGV